VELLVDELTAGFPERAELARIVIRLIAAMLLGAVIGLQRESVGAAAGLRTHMLVTVGAAMFVLTPLSIGMSSDDLSRVIQGVATGIGFIGGGAVLKLTAEREIRGLTTAASIWLGTAAGIAAGTGRIGLAAVGVALSWVILSILGRVQHHLAARAETRRSPLLDAHTSAAGDESRGEAQVPDQLRERRVLVGADQP
jgi:putative Mg2+ transporter-C (MgtC) family protein